MATPRFTWITTVIEHRDCEKCADCVDGARIHASVTGSIGATYNDDRTQLDGTHHSATVRRSDHMNELAIEKPNAGLWL